MDENSVPGYRKEKVAYACVCLCAISIFFVNF